MIHFALFIFFHVWSWQTMNVLSHYIISQQSVETLVRFISPLLFTVSLNDLSPSSSLHTRYVLCPPHPSSSESSEYLWRRREPADTVVCLLLTVLWMTANPSEDTLQNAYSCLWYFQQHFWWRHPLILADQYASAFGKNLTWPRNSHLW